MLFGFFLFNLSTIFSSWSTKGLGQTHPLSMANHRIININSLGSFYDDWSLLSAQDTNQFWVLADSNLNSLFDQNKKNLIN